MTKGDRIKGGGEKLLKEMNYCHWYMSESPRMWVEARTGQWNHSDWLSLLDELQRARLWPIDEGAVGRKLEDLKSQYWCRRESTLIEECRRWMADYQRRSDISDAKFDDMPEYIKCIEELGAIRTPKAIAVLEQVRANAMFAEILDAVVAALG